MEADQLHTMFKEHSENHIMVLQKAVQTFTNSVQTLSLDCTTTAGNIAVHGAQRSLL
jgi:hypothetical protein